MDVAGAVTRGSATSRIFDCVWLGFISVSIVRGAGKLIGPRYKVPDPA
jgi:hypothetical protein